MTRTRVFAIAVGLVACGLLARAADDPGESGTFTLFKFEQAIGIERYQIAPEGDHFSLTSVFSFVDRGTNVVLNTSLQFLAGLTPTHFTIKGDVARLSTIDAEVKAVPPGTFTLAGYAPVSMQMQLLRYWCRMAGLRRFRFCRRALRGSSRAAATRLRWLAGLETPCRSIATA